MRQIVRIGLDIAKRWFQVATSKVCGRHIEKQSNAASWA